jgi:hypothetical protein
MSPHTNNVNKTLALIQWPKTWSRKHYKKNRFINTNPTGGCFKVFVKIKSHCFKSHRSVEDHGKKKNKSRKNTIHKYHTHKCKKRNTNTNQTPCLIYVICRITHVLYTLFVWGLMSYIRYLYEGSCLIYVICRRAHVLYTLFVGGLMSYIRYLYEGSCLIYVICMRAHVLYTLFVWGLMSYIRYLYEGSCLIYVICMKPSYT